MLDRRSPRANFQVRMISRRSISDRSPVNGANGAASLTTLLQMVAYGQGVTLIPEMAVAAGALSP